MRIVHTSDWHLGHSLHEISRRAEHLAFFAWLLGRLEELEADALLVAGDIFDTSNPSAEAQADLYEFLAAARTRMPRLDIVLVGGNHDSASRLDAPEPLLRAFGTRVVGGLPRTEDGAIDHDRLVVPLTDKEGQHAAKVVAMPFLRPADLPVIKDEGVDALIEGMREVYAEVITEAERRLVPGQALLAMGHLYMTGTAISELSERKILGGNQHALPADLFPESLAYVALGHLHLAQPVSRESIRYSGSPIPLSMAEINYPHQVCIVDIEDGKLVSVRSERIPRHVELLRVPAEARPLTEVEAVLADMPSRAHLPPDTQPIIEVPVLLEQPEPGLRTRVEKALEGKGVRLARISTHYKGSGKALADGQHRTTLQDLQPEEVLRRRWAREHEGEPPAEMLAAFHQLLGEAQADAEAA
ncbi:MAG: exonuclease SbcCD subunit D C-terminal domain-containing protein [Rubrivivax sp.]